MSLYHYMPKYWLDLVGCRSGYPEALKLFGRIHIPLTAAQFGSLGKGDNGFLGFSVSSREIPPLGSSKVTLTAKSYLVYGFICLCLSRY